MSRYIDADNYKKDLIHLGFLPALVVSVLDKQPTADVVEVVRCRDCKYVRDEIMGGLWCDHPDNRNPLGCRPIDFCNDGERRENDGT